ncbi:hypothetical protein C3F09_04390 [candidate division GN15 bacterium]|uniref:Outer membrane protein beta-barrel domain-containing protein n=1 Tax=candidate division GN15 bacterium TaxID=2072418 RepID=A0A855X818_9BACT|nr:MAG: hypothetical protein C3F09_04390 [candidate division GN15 bacterium]
MSFNRSTILRLTTLLVIAFCATTHAFDGKRKGFVAGFGLGFTPIASLSADRLGIETTKSGFGANMLAGYAWDDRNMIVYEGSGCLSKVSELGSSYVLQGLNGVGWYHYWGNSNRRVFTSVGIGLMVFSTEHWNVDGHGFGYSAGVGYEFLKQLQVGLYYAGGHTSNDYGVSANHTVLNLLVTLVAY